jgi:membrane protease YdiL (CAAX protease family)
MFGVMIAAVIAGTYILFGRDLIDVEHMRQAASANGIGTPGKYLLFVTGLTLVNSLLEEYVWRWFVFRQCERLVPSGGGGGAMAVILSALMFTLHHFIALAAQTSLSVTLLGSLGVFIGGCAWSWCYLRYRSVWPGWVSHVIVDAAVFVVGWMILFAG